MGDRAVVELSEGQLLKLAELIHSQEVDQLKTLKFKSYTERQKYLKDCLDSRNKVYDLINDVKIMKAKTEAEAEKEDDITKAQIAHDVYEYCTKSISQSLQFIRSYNSRLTYLGKLKSHCNDMIEQLYRLTPMQMKEAQRLAIEADMYKKAILDYSRKFQSFVPNQFTRWIKENRVKFEDLLEQSMGDLQFAKPFKNLPDIQKLQVYERIIERAGLGKPVVTYTLEALGKVGVALLLVTAATMVWDIYTANNKMETAVRDSVNALVDVVNLEVGQIVNAAVEAGFEALDIEIATMVITVTGAVVGIGVGVLIGIAAAGMLDLIFSSGTTKKHSTDGLTACRIAPMPNGLKLARQIKYNFPDL